MFGLDAVIVNVADVGLVDRDKLWYCPPEGSENVTPEGDVMMLAPWLSVVVSVMLAVMTTLVPVVADVADDEVVTELTEADTDTTDTISMVNIENKIKSFLILSYPENICNIYLL